jgi:hypothetical protein
LREYRRLSGRAGLDRAKRRADESVKETRDWKRKWTGRMDGLGGKTKGRNEGTRDVAMEGCRSNIKTVEEDRILGTTFKQPISRPWMATSRPRTTIRRARAHRPASLLHHLKFCINLHGLERYDGLSSIDQFLSTTPPMRTALSGDQLPCATTTNESESSDFCSDRNRRTIQHRLSQQLIGSIASALGMSILSLSTTKRRYPPTPPSFDIRHGICRSISHWYTSTDKKERTRS